MKLQRAVDRAVRDENASYLRELKAAGPDACPNCLNHPKGCWLCRPERRRS